MKEKKALIEAALYVSEEPLTLNALSKISGITSMKDLKNILDEIKLELDANQKGIELVFTGEGYQFQVRDKFLDKVAVLSPHSDLSDGMLRTLGIVAVRQPVSQSQVVKIQGNKAYNHIKRLEKRKLVISEKAGRTKVLKTTKEFEKYFGRSLEDIQGRLKKVIAEPDVR